MTLKDDKHRIPPNFTPKDLRYVLEQGAVFGKRDGSTYLTNLNSTCLEYIDTLWAIDATQK